MLDLIPTQMIGWLFVLKGKNPVSAVKTEHSYRKDSRTDPAASWELVIQYSLYYWLASLANSDISLNFLDLDCQYELVVCSVLCLLLSDCETFETRDTYINIL